MYYDVLKAGEKHGLPMPYFKGFGPYIDDMVKRLKDVKLKAQA